MWLLALFVLTFHFADCAHRHHGQRAASSECASLCLPLPSAPLPFQVFQQDVIVNADLWAPVPRIMSCGLGFIGVTGAPCDPITRECAQQMGSTWLEFSDPQCNGNDPTVATNLKTSAQYVPLVGRPLVLQDALPVCFSWPARPSTVAPESFVFTLSNGTTVTPLVATLIPNSELNERTCVVVFGQLGNRGRPGEPGAVYPVSLRIASKLELLGPRGFVSAVGLTCDNPSSPYALPDGGPRLLAAKMSHTSVAGEGNGLPSALMPNDCAAMHGSAAAYRLRMFYSGGFSPDGVSGIRPGEFARFFQLVARGATGADVVIDAAGVPFAVAGGQLTVLGLADLGANASLTSQCYAVDADNYIDICISATSESAARAVHTLTHPARDGGRLYNPGGPGNSPFAGVRYTSPAPANSVAVTNALDDPQTVTFRCQPQSQ